MRKNFQRFLKLKKVEFDVVAQCSMSKVAQMSRHNSARESLCSRLA